MGWGRWYGLWVALVAGLAAACLEAPPTSGVPDGPHGPALLPECRVDFTDEFDGLDEGVWGMWSVPLNGPTVSFDGAFEAVLAGGESAGLFTLGGRFGASGYRLSVTERDLGDRTANAIFVLNFIDGDRNLWLSRRGEEIELQEFVGEESTLLATAPFDPDHHAVRIADLRDGTIDWYLGDGVAEPTWLASSDYAGTEVHVEIKAARNEGGPAPVAFERLVVEDCR